MYVFTLLMYDYVYVHFYKCKLYAVQLFWASMWSFIKRPSLLPQSSTLKWSFRLEEVECARGDGKSE